MDAEKTHEEKAKWELRKNATIYIEEILEATPHETTALRSLNSDLENHPNKMIKICGTLLEKQGRTQK